MSASATARLARAIGYPQAVPEGASTFTLMVDDGAVTATDAGGRLVLQATLALCGDKVEELATLAGYAAGRILREDAVLAYDPQGDSVVLWQSIGSGASPMELRQFFERYTASWDWWRARVEELENPKPSFPEVMIRP